jgi:hypothetical protein
MPEITVTRAFHQGRRLTFKSVGQQKIRTLVKKEGFFKGIKAEV